MLPPLQMETIKKREARERTRAGPRSTLLRGGGASSTEIRIPKSEARKKAEIRNPKSPWVYGSYLLIAFLALLAGCTPPGPRALLQGTKLIEQGKYAEAVTKLETATSI